MLPKIGEAIAWEEATVKGGEKMYRVGGSTGVFGLSTFRENVRLTVQQKCPSAIRGIVSDVDAGRLAGDRRVGGFSASM